jgi:hypothetical protein
MSEQPRRKSKAALLREEYERQLAELQASCPHAEVSDWIGTLNDPEDIDARRYCLECEKVLHVMRTCRECRRRLIDDEARFGPGGTLAWGAAYCADCLPRAEERWAEKRRQANERPNQGL